jgi:aminoglycoside phosphotransferase (APT) family kinase protein
VTIPTGVAGVRAALTTFLATQIADCTELEVTAPVRTSRGFARENWLFDASWSDTEGRHSAELILRRDPQASLLVTSREREFAVLRYLESASFEPVPRVRWLDATGEFFGRPAIIMDRITRGVCDWFVLNNPARALDDRLLLAHHYIDVLAAVQSVPWRGTRLEAALAPVGPSAADTERAYWADVLHAYQLEPYPELELIYHWLKHNAPPPGDLVLTHGDVKPGNMLIDGTTIVALLDWETAHIGDPLEDLGWITNPFRRAEQQIEGVWERPEITAYFTEATGRSVDDDALVYWNVFAIFKLAVITITGLHAFASGMNCSVYWGPAEFIGVAFELMGGAGASVA